MASLGHYHERDDNMRADCEGCIEERILMLLLKGKTRDEAITIVERELRRALSTQVYPPSRQIER